MQLQIENGDFTNYTFYLKKIECFKNFFKKWLLTLFQKKESKNTPIYRKNRNTFMYKIITINSLVTYVTMFKFE